MMLKLARLSVWMVPLLFATVCQVSLYASSQIAGEKAENPSAGTKQSVTGCLQKGDEPGGFTIIGEDNKVWELHSENVRLADHVGHTVKVSGSTVNRSKTQEEKIEANERKETAGKEHGDLRISSLKMISDSCK